MEQWILDLRVGDTVCDCRYKHLKIIRIDEDIIRGKHVDRSLQLEDGSNCSAKHCCSPADHEPEEFTGTNLSIAHDKIMGGKE